MDEKEHFKKIRTDYDTHGWVTLKLNQEYLIAVIDWKIRIKVEFEIYFTYGKKLDWITEKISLKS